jgi:hypothetical protein
LLFDESFSGDGQLLKKELYSYRGKEGMHRFYASSKETDILVLPETETVDLILCYNKKDLVREFVINYIRDMTVPFEELIDESKPFLHYFESDAPEPKREDEIGIENARECFEGLRKSLDVFVKKLSRPGKFVNALVVGPLIAAGLNWPFRYAMLHNSFEFLKYSEDVSTREKKRSRKEYYWKRALVEKPFVAWSTVVFPAFDKSQADKRRKKFLSLLAFVPLSEHFDALVAIDEWRQLVSPDEKEGQRIRGDPFRGDPSHVLYFPPRERVSVIPPKNAIRDEILETFNRPSRIPDDSLAVRKQSSEIGQTEEHIVPFQISDDDEEEEEEGERRDEDAMIDKDKEYYYASKKMDDLSFLPVYLRICEEDAISVFGYFKKVHPKDPKKFKWFFSLNFQRVELERRRMSSNENKNGNVRNDVNGFQILFIRTKPIRETEPSNKIDLSKYRIDVYEYDFTNADSPLAVIGFKNYGLEEDCMFVVPNHSKTLVMEVCLKETYPGESSKLDKESKTKLISSFLERDDDAS